MQHQSVNPRPPLPSRPSGRQPAVPPTAAPVRRRTRRPSWKDVELLELPEATDFSSDPELVDPIALIRELKQHPQYLDKLRELCSPTPEPERITVEVENEHGEIERQQIERRQKSGRPRMAGDWFLVYLAYVASRDPALQSFFNRWARHGVFREAGFDRIPDYNTVWLRFAELERHWQAFSEVAGDLIRQARRHQPAIGQVVHVDASGYQTHAGLEHCCADKERCRRLREKQAKARGLKGLGAKLPFPKYLPQATYDELQELRKEENEAAEPDDVSARPRSAGAFVGVVGRHAYWDFDGHTYRSLDTTARMRTYTRGSRRKSWLGGFGMPAIDHLTGAPLRIEVFPADEAEYHHYPALYEGLEELLEQPPLAVTVDAGATVRSLYEFNTRRGVATVGPWRKRSGAERREQMRTDAYDEHGIPRCPNCGGEGNVDSAGLGLVFVGDEPYLRFRCLAPFAPECKKTRRIACAKEWALLVPLSRKQELYYDLRRTHQSFERVFGHWRARYGVLGKDHTGRLKRRGLPAQRLRVNAALLLEWLRLCLRHGWLGSWRTLNPRRPRRQNGIGSRSLERVLAARRKRLLDLPYGKAAERLALKRAQAPPEDPWPDPNDDPTIPF